MSKEQQEPILVSISLEDYKDLIKKAALYDALRDGIVSIKKESVSRIIGGGVHE